MPDWFWLHSVLTLGGYEDDAGGPYIFSKRIKRQLFDPFLDVDNAEEQSLRDTVFTLLNKTVAEYVYDDGNVSIMSTADADDPSAVNGRLRPRKSSLGGSAGPPPGSCRAGTSGPPRTSRPARKPNDDKTKKPAISVKKPPENQDETDKSLSYLKSLCPYCSRRFGSRNSVTKHISRTHSSGSKAEPNQCQFCKHSEVEAADIVRHMVDSHPNQYFACLECHSRFASTAELAVHKLQICERQKPQSYRNKLRSKPAEGKSSADNEYPSAPDFNGIVISCELKPSQEQDTADIEDNITTNLILPPGKTSHSLVSTSLLDKNAVIVLDDIQWNKRMPPNFTFHNSDADQILSRLGVVHRSPRASDHSRWYKHIEDTTKFERCFDTSFYSKVASNVQENLNKFLDGSFNRFQLDPENVIKTRRAKNSVIINTAEGFPILLAHEQYSRNLFDSYMPRAIAPKHKWKWDSIESDRHPINPDQIKRDSHVNNCIITLVSSLDIWTQLRMRRKFEAKFNISSFNEKNTEKQSVIVNELKEILESREIPHREVLTQVTKYAQQCPASTSASEFPSSLGLMRATPQQSVSPAVLSGEWVRPRCYVCCACGEKAQDSKQLSIHIAAQHPVAQVAHYEVVGESLLSADILKHLYVPPSQPVSRSRPLRGIRECTKCKKTTTLEELHQHMLECAGDTPAVRRKGRNRPFGVRRRRTRLPEVSLRKKVKVLRSRQRQKNHMRPRPRIRTEVGDAETIRKMIADLPAKRHRASVTPPNPMLRPRRMRDLPRNKLLMKRRQSDDPKNQKQRGGKDFASPGSSQATGKEAGSSGKDPGASGTQRNHNIAKSRISRIATKVMRQKEVFKRKTLMRNAKRKARAIIEAASKEHFDDPPVSCSFKSAPTENLAADNTSNRIDVNKSSGNSRGHAARDGNGSQGGRKTGGGGNDQAQNGENNQQAQNTPLKHSIARLTAATETHDKAVQFQPHFLVQQECYKNIDRPYRPTEPQRLFENDIAAAELDKPPLQEHLSPADLYGQKNKANKPRKGLNDCIAMLKNKLVEPSSPSSTGHRSVQCDTADMPQYATPPLPQLPEYISEPSPRDPVGRTSRASRRSAAASLASDSSTMPAPYYRTPSASVTREITPSPPMMSVTIASQINPYLAIPSLSITPFTASPSTPMTRSSRFKSTSPATKPSVTVTRSSARTSAATRLRSQKQSVQRHDAAAMSPPAERSRSTDSQPVARRSPHVTTMMAPPVQTMGPPCPVMPPAAARSPVSYTPWALSKSPVTARPTSPTRSPVNYPQLGITKSPVNFTSSPPLGQNREKSPGCYSLPNKNFGTGHQTQKPSEKSPDNGHSTPEKSLATLVSKAPESQNQNIQSHAFGGAVRSSRDKSPGMYQSVALAQPPVLYMSQGYVQSPATYPPRTPEKLPVIYPPQTLENSPVSYQSQTLGKLTSNWSQNTAKSPVNFMVKPVAKLSADYSQPDVEKLPLHYAPRDPVIQTVHESSAPAISSMNFIAQSPAKSPVTFVQTSSTTSSSLDSLALAKSNSVSSLLINASPPPQEDSQAPPKSDKHAPAATKVNFAVTSRVTTNSPADSSLQTQNMQPFVAQTAGHKTLSMSDRIVKSPLTTPLSSATKSPISMAPAYAPASFSPITPMNNPRPIDIHTETTYPILQMDIPPAHVHTNTVSMLSPLDLSGKSSSPISLFKSAYDDSYETLDLSNKGASFDHQPTVSRDEPTDLVTEDDVVDLCIKKLTTPEVVETLDLSAKVQKTKEDNIQVVMNTEQVTQEESLKQVQELQPKHMLPSDYMLKPVYDPTLKIPQFKIRPTTSSCTTSDEKHPSPLKDVPTPTKCANSCSNAGEIKSTAGQLAFYGTLNKDTNKEDISNSPDTTMASTNIPNMMAREKENKEAHTSLPIAAASIAACSSALSGTLSSKLATSIMNTLVSMPRSIDAAVTATTSTSCATSNTNRRSEIVVPIGSVEDLETAKKIAMLPKEILEILGKMPTDHRNQLLDVLPQYMVYNNAVKQLKLVVDISPDSLTTPIGIAKLSSNKSEIATQTSSTSTEEICPPEYLNVDTEKFLIDPFTGAITERAQQEYDTDKPDSDGVIDMTKDADTDKVEESELAGPCAKEALNLIANKEMSETSNTFTIPSVAKGNKPKEGSEKTASLRAVRIKTSERRMSQQNLKNLIGQVVHKIPTVCNNDIQETEELRLQLEAKTPPAIQQAEVSSTQQNGNRNISIDSTSPVATKNMNLTTQNKERRTSTGVDEHDSSNNSVCVDEVTPKVSNEPFIVEDKDVKSYNITNMPSVPEINDSLLNAPKNPVEISNVVEEVLILNKHDSEFIDLLTSQTNAKDKEISMPKNEKTLNSDDSDDDDISLAVILKKKKLSEHDQPIENQVTTVTNKKVANKKAKKSTNYISQTLKIENFESDPKNQESTKELPAVTSKNEDQTQSKNKVDILTTRTKNNEPSSKKSKGRRGNVNKGNKRNSEQLTEVNIEKVFDITKATSHDKENTNESSNVGIKSIIEKTNCDTVLIKADTTMNYSKTNRDEADIAKPEPLESINKNASIEENHIKEIQKSIPEMPDSTETAKSNDKIALFKSNTGKSSKKRKKRLSAEKEILHCEINSVLKDKISPDGMEITPTLTESVETKTGKEKLISVKTNSSEEQNSKIKSSRPKDNKNKSSDDLTFPYYPDDGETKLTESKSQEPKLKTAFDEIDHTDKYSLSSKSSRSKRSNRAKDSKKTASSNESVTSEPLEIEEHQTKLVVSPNVIFDESTNSDECIAKIKYGHSKKSNTVNDKPKTLFSDDSIDEISKYTEPMLDEPKVKFTETPANAEENDDSQYLLKTKSRRTKRPKSKDSSKTGSVDDLSLSNNSEDALKPLRRSQRGKSMYVESPILDTPESLQTDIFMENRAPLTKKQLIFSKLLLDEENIAKLASNPVVSSRDENPDNAKSIAYSVANDDRNVYTPDATIDETSIIVETVPELRKSSKRKKSPHAKQRSKRIKSFEKDEYECVLLDSNLPPNNLQEESHLGISMDVSEVLLKNISAEKDDTTKQKPLAEMSRTKDDTKNPILSSMKQHNISKENYDLDITDMDLESTMEENNATKESNEKPRKHKRSTHKRKTSRYINTTPICNFDAKTTKQHLEAAVSVGEQETSQIEDSNEYAKTMSVTSNSKAKNNKTNVQDIVKIGPEQPPKVIEGSKEQPPNVSYTHTSKAKRAKHRGRKISETVDSQEKIVAEDSLDPTSNVAPANTSKIKKLKNHVSKTVSEQPSIIKEDSNDRPPKTSATSSNREKKPNSNLIDIVDRVHKQQSTAVENSNERISNAMNTQHSKGRKAKKLSQSLDDQKLTATELPNDWTENSTATASAKEKKPKKNTTDVAETFGNDKPTVVENSTRDTNALRNEPTKTTTCYDMPRAVARTRAKSLLIKSFMDEIYDPYDIDMEDKLLEDIQPITTKTKVTPKDTDKKTKKKTRPSTSSEDLSEGFTNKNQAVASKRKDSSCDSDSSKSDVPLKKYADDNAKAQKKIVKDGDGTNAKPSDSGSSERPLNKKKTGKRKRKADQVVENPEESAEKQIDNAEELRSEQFMESFGFFSERKPRKSNLLASKKISETFHIIANENDDFYFRNKEKTAKKSDKRKSTSVSHTYDLECTARGTAHCHPRRGRRRRKKRVPNPLTYCEICRKEFRRPDNYLRHQMTIVHVSRLLALQLTPDADPLPDIPNYLVIYRQHLEKLRRLTEKLQRKNKKLGLDPSKIKLPTIQDIIADANIQQYNLKKNNVRRGLSRDEALFLHCCELLKSNQNEITSLSAYSHRASATVTSRSLPSTSTMVTASTSASEPSTSKCNDGDVDSITAKTIMESEEVRNLENDLISGIKEAAKQNRAGSASNQRNYDYDTGIDHDFDLDDHDLDLDSAIPNLESRLARHRQGSSGDELTDKLSSPKTGDSPFSPVEDLDSAEERPRVRKGRRSAAKLIEMLDIDLFEDKFDKIKRKCRSQAAAAAKNTQSVSEPIPSTSGISFKAKKKTDKKKTKKSALKNQNQNTIMTKGALKGFDGFKVSIPTSDINMAAIGLGESPPRKKKKGIGKKSRQQTESSGKSVYEQPGPSGRAGPASQAGSSRAKYDDAQPGPSGTQGNLDVYEFLDNDDADFFPSTLKERYKTLKHTPSTKDSYQRDDDSASGSDGDDFVYMSDDYPCSADETENSVMSCDLPGKINLERKAALKRKDAVEKNAVMGKIFKNNAVRTDKKSAKGKEPAKSCKANLDQLFDSLLQEPAGPTSPADKGRDTPVPNSDSDSEPFGAASPLPDAAVEMHQRNNLPETRQPDRRRSPVAQRWASPGARRWAHSSMLSPSSTLEDPQPGTSRDSLPYDLSDNEADGGVARHRARRKCTVGKQNVLAESWSSESEPDGGMVRANSTESVLTPVARKKKGKKSNGNQQAQKRARHVSFKKQESAPEPGSGPPAVAGGGGGGGLEEGSAGRAASAAVYTWSEGEAEAPAHAPQHGWIVGNSHKKLVTMLAHAKGRRRDDKRNLDE